MCRKERWFVKAHRVKDDLIRYKMLSNNTGGAEKFTNTPL